MKRAALLFVVLSALPEFLAAGQLTGTAILPEHVMLPSGAVFEAALEDVSRADAPAEVLGHARQEVPGRSPFRFQLPYDDALIQPSHDYSVRGRVLLDGQPLFATGQKYPVLTRGNQTTVEITLEPLPGVAIDRFKPARGLGALPARFAGEVSCKNCPGPHWRLELLPDQTFSRRRGAAKDQGGSDDLGAWSVSADGAMVTLEVKESFPNRFRVVNAATLRPLDGLGRELASDGRYDLKRVEIPVKLEPKLNMTGMYRYLADAGLFTECRTRRRLPVLTEADNRRLEQAYGQLRHQPGEEILVELEGRIVDRPNEEGGEPVPMLRVERYVQLWPGETCGAQSAAATLENTYWKLTRLGRSPVIPAGNQREPHLVLHAENQRLAGFGGCNQLMGSYRAEGEQLLFTRVASTRMACTTGMDIERSLLEALEQTSGRKITGDHLELLDGGGKVLARFEAVYLR